MSPEMQRAPLEARNTADMPMSHVACAWPSGKLLLTASAAPGASLAMPASTLPDVTPLSPYAAWDGPVGALEFVQGHSAGLLCCGHDRCQASSRPPGFSLTDGPPPICSCLPGRASSAEPAAASWLQEPRQPHTAPRKRSASDRAAW